MKVVTILMHGNELTDNRQAFNKSAMGITECFRAQAKRVIFEERRISQSWKWKIATLLKKNDYFLRLFVCFRGLALITAAKLNPMA